MTRKDKWAKRPCVVRYRDFCDSVRQHISELPGEFSVIFHVPMPESWPKKKRHEKLGEPHVSRPDLDNYVKGLCDILSEDSHIWHIDARKVWSNEGFIEIHLD